MRRRRSTNQRGAQLANRSAYRHGLYSPRLLARGCSYPDSRANKYRRALEDAVIDVHGMIDIESAGLIHTAAEATKVALENRAKKREAFREGRLTDDLALRFDHAYLRALEIRDAKVKALNLDKDEREDVIQLLYGPQHFSASVEAEDGTSAVEGPSDTDPEPNTPPATAQGTGDPVEEGEDDTSGT